jgi:hypothetical protein
VKDGRAGYAREEPDSPQVERILRKLRNLEHHGPFALPVIEELAAFPESGVLGAVGQCAGAASSKVLRQPEGVLAVFADIVEASATSVISQSFPKP